MITPRSPGFVAIVCRYLRDAVARLGLASAAFRAYGAVLRTNPVILCRNAHFRRYPTPEGLRIPPSNLVFLVAGTPDVRWFLAAGRLAAQTISDVLSKCGSPIDGMKTILDFGCGCGRVTRYWSHLVDTQVHGT